MNKRKFIILIFMMLISLVGITWIQLVWIRNAVRIENGKFNAIAIEGISDAANSIESSRKMDFFNSYIFPQENVLTDTLSGLSGYLSVGSYTSAGGGNFSVRITNQSITQEYGKEPVVVTHDTLITSDSGTFIMSSPDDPGKMTIVENKNGNTDNNGGVYIRQDDYVELIKKRYNELQNIGDQMLSEVFQWENMELDNREIQYALNRSLYYLQTPFEFAVIKNGVVTDGSYKRSQKNDFLKSIYKVRLFPDNIIRQDLVLSVVFPERTNYVLGSMAGILTGSLLFSLIILATFAMSLFLIIRQKKVSEMKSDFINNMTHEFKTPIATISLAADTITNPKVIRDESSIRHFIGMIKKENSRMNKKVETILQIASLDKKEMDFKFENLSIHSVIERAVESLDILVQQRNGRITLVLDASNPVIYGDYEHLFNLVNNLLDNAIKYSDKSPEITVRTKNNGEGVILSVEDKGIGMSKHVQNRIFERFYRQTSGNVHDVKGFGLGLNYSRAIVDAHKGTITVNSEPGKGSRFDVFLPFNWSNE
jgi:two-component system phosphate regulon sensor histidine kinase PhoR